MPNYQLAPAKYQFCDSCNERLMFRSKTKNVEKSTVQSYFFKVHFCCVKLCKLLYEFCASLEARWSFASSSNDYVHSRDLNARLR